MNPPKKSWRTTTCGVLAIIGSLIPAAIAFLDGDPATSVDIQAVGIAIMGLFGGGGLIAARDNKVSSEDAGVK